MTRINGASVVDIFATHLRLRRIKRASARQDYGPSGFISKETKMVRSAGGKRVSRDMTKAIVKSHVATPAGRHASTMKTPTGPKAGKGARKTGKGS